MPVDFVTLLCLTLFELGHPSTESEASFDLVSDVGSVRAPSAARSETRESILPPCPAKFLRDSSRLCGSSWIGRDRLDRAWTAGNWAKAVLAKRIGSPNRTPPLDLRPWALGSYLGSYHFSMSMKPECIWKHPASQIDPLLPEGPNGDSDSHMTVDSLVTISQDIEPYVLEWPVLELRRRGFGFGAAASSRGFPGSPSNWTFAGRGSCRREQGNSAWSCRSVCILFWLFP